MMFLKKTTDIGVLLGQPWVTQIGSRATFLKNRHFKGQNLDFFQRSNQLCYTIANSEKVNAVDRLAMADLGSLGI